MIKSPVRSVVRNASPFLTGLLRSVSRLAFDFRDLVGLEEAGGNANVFYNPQDLDSLTTGVNATGGQPVVGDPVGTMFDVSGAGSMRELMSAQPELVTNGGFDTASDWNSAFVNVAITGGKVVFTAANQFTDNIYQDLGSGVSTGNFYEIEIVVSDYTDGIVGVQFDNHVLLSITAAGTYRVRRKTLTTNPYVYIQARGTSGTNTFSVDSISIKKIPGYVATTVNDAARPTLMDDPDTTWAPLTDDGTRGEAINSVTSYGSSGGTESGLPFEQGSDYEVTFTVESRTVGTMKPQFTGGVAQIGTPVSANGTYTETLTATNNANFQMVAGGGFDGTVSNISVRKVNTAFDERASSFITTPNDVSSDTFFFDITASTDVIAAPDGSLTADLIQENGANNFHGFRHDPFGFLLFGEIYTAEVWLKAKERRYATISLGSSSAIRSSAIHVDVATGTVLDISDTTLVSYEVTAGTDGWYKFSLTTKINYQDGIFFVWLSDSPTTTFGGAYLSTLYQGDGSSGMYVWGYNLYGRVSPNLLLNSTSDDDSTFDTDTGNWAKGTGWSIGSGVATHTSGTGSGLDIGITVTPQKWYKVTWYVSSISGGSMSVEFRGGTTVAVATGVFATGWHSAYARAATGNNTLRFYAGAATDVTIDNVIIQELPSTTPTSYYLDTDGVDDWMKVTPTLGLGEQWWHTGAWKLDDGNGLDRPFANTSGYQSSPLAQDDKWLMWRAGGSYDYISNGSCVVPHVLTIEQYDTNAMRGTVNGVGFDTFTPFDDSGAVQGLALFSEKTSAYAYGIDGRFYGGAWGQGQVNYDNLDTIQKYLGSVIDIEPTPVTPYTDVYDMLGAQTAALFDIQDISSLRVGRDGSGLPVDGDPVGMMLDVSGAGGDNMSNYLAGQPELVANGTFDTDSDWTKGAGWTISGGQAILASGSTAVLSQPLTTELGKSYLVEFTLQKTGGYLRVDFAGVNTGLNYTNGTINYSKVVKSIDINAGISIQGGLGTADWQLDNVSVKELPGYVATAPSDAARPTLLSVLDTAASELTDDGTRGGNLVTSTDAADWTRGFASVDGTFTYSAGSFTYTLGPGDTSGARFTLELPNLEIGATYEVTANGSGTGTPAIGVALFSAGTGTVTLDNTLPLSFTVTASQSTLYLWLACGGSSGDTAVFSDISIKKVQTVFDGRGDELEGSVFSPASTANGQLLETGLGNQVQGGKFYEIVYNWTNNTAAGFFELRMRGGDAGYSQPLLFNNQAASGTRSEIWYVGTTGTLQARWYFSGASGDVDVTVSVKEVLTPNLLLTSAGDDNSTFDTQGDWTLESGVTVSSGRLNWTNANVATASVPVSFEAGKHYKVQFYVHSQSSDGIFSQEPFDIPTTRLLGWHTYYGQAVTNANELKFTANSSDTTISIDNVIVQEVPASVARNYYLDFDGADDNLILDATDFSTSTNVTLYKTFRGDRATTQQIMFGSIAGPYILAASSGDNNPSLNGTVGSPVYRQDGAIASYATRAALYAALVDNTDRTIGVEEVDLSAHAAWTSSGFYIGGEYAVSWNSDGRLYSWAAVDTRLDGRNRDLLENFMLNRKPAPTFGVLSRFGAPILTRDGSTIIPRS